MPEFSRVNKILDCENKLAHHGSMNISDAIRHWRKFEDLTLKEAAKRIGLTIPTLSRVEHDGDMDGKTMALLVRWLLSPRQSV